MKKTLILVFIFVAAFSYHVDRTDMEHYSLERAACPDAHAKEKPGKCALYGRIQYVTSFPDVKVQAVTSFPDIRVQIVKAFPDGPGKWQVVDSFPDFRVQMVDSFPDYRVQFVTSFPGCQ